MGDLLHHQPPFQDVFQTELGVAIEDYLEDLDGIQRRYAAVGDVSEIPTRHLQILRRCLVFLGRELQRGMHFCKSLTLTLTWPSGRKTSQRGLHALPS